MLEHENDTKEMSDTTTENYTKEIGDTRTENNTETQRQF